MVKLSTDGTPYSGNERRAFAAMPKTGRPISTTELAERMYKNGNGPANARQVALAVMVALSRKVKRNREAYVIKRTARSGPYPLQWRIEAR